ncbi:probable chitinase 10 [Musca vetustissima]|uniref:probable chitinase 10 n=1 Tax=Musca vetustissima TaxID=27455 RepID=UPI002AB62EDF|nr:probable chitinase 10 [Musca vetustissima]
MIAYKILMILMALGGLAKATEISSLERPFPHPQCPKIDDPYRPILLAYPQDCSKYYSCQNGMAYLEQCPGNYLWNPLNQLCDYPERVSCVQPTPDIPRPGNNDARNIYYQLYPNDCSRYYKCEAQTCPPNYYWNSYKQHCDLPQLAQCPFEPVMPPATTYPPVIPTAPTVPPPPPPAATDPNAVEECTECASWCLGQGHIYLPYPQDCRKFIQCNGLAFIHKCPDQLLWNDKLKTCDRFCVRNDAPLANANVVE